MGEHNLLNPGFFGQLVNIHTRDARYLSNVRASGGPLAGIGHTPRFSRRDNVCSLPWNPSEPCTGYPQSYVSINSTYNQSCDIPLQEDNKCFYSESARATSGGGDNNSTILKSNEKARENSSVSTSAENGLKNLNGMDNRGSYSKYDYLTTAEYLTPDPPSCRSLESDSGSSLLNEGAKTPSGITHSLTSPDIHASDAALNGGESLESLVFMYQCEDEDLEEKSCMFSKKSSKPLGIVHFLIAYKVNFVPCLLSKLEQKSLQNVLLFCF